MNVCVIGGGYVGTVTAVGLATGSTVVTLIETDPGRARRFAEGEVPFHEPGLQEAFAEASRSGSLRTTTDAASSLAGAEIVLICVGTPLDAAGEADLSQVQAACRTIREHAPDTVVVIRSTLPLGTTDAVIRWLGRSDGTNVATNPEFLRQGTALADFRRPTRIVVGTATGAPTPASDLVERLYDSLDAPLILADFASAEMIKNAANAFLAIKLSFVNEIADLCEAYGGDVEMITRGIGLDPRIGQQYLRPGIGFGGSCLPKELDNLVRLGQDQNMAIHMFAAASRSNRDRPRRIAARIERLLGPLDGVRIGMLGMAFKADTDDARYSPALALARELGSLGARVRAHDPKVPAAVAQAAVPTLDHAATIEDAVRDARLVLIATEWAEYRSLDWRAIASLVASRVVFDGRNLLDRSAMEQAGWRVLSIGTRLGEEAI